ncbi:MAG: tetratricopeptide repeat protein [Chloroflexi bacterium]|nr:tetratricopeptide repeat protein [Chloroflexota bacterium]
MAGNKQIFDAAMRRGQEFASNREWDKALREYMRAATEFPNDINMRSNLADALFRMGRNQESLDVYQGLVKFNPNNTNALQRSGEIYARLGRSSESIAVFYQLKDVFLKNNQTAQVIETLQQVVKVDPSRTEAYREIIETAKARGDRKTGASAALSFATFCKSAGAYQDASSAVEEALMLQPGLSEAVQFKHELEGLRPSSDSGRAGGVEAKSAITSVESAKQDAITRLLSDAEEALNDGDTGRALRQYQTAVEAGAEGAEILYTIGGLYSQQGNYEEAAKYLRQAAEDGDYAASAFFALGQMYDEAGEPAQAIRAYEEALLKIDLQQIGQDEIDELIMMHEPLAEAYLKLGQEEQAANLYNRLRDFIQSKKLRTEKTSIILIKARELGEKLSHTATSSLRLGAGSGSSAPAGRDAGGNFNFSSSESVQPNDQTGGLHATLVENGVTTSHLVLIPDLPAEAVVPPVTPISFPVKLLQMEPNPSVYPYLQAAEDFAKRGLTLAAIDACQEIVRYFPDYLPAQVVLAEVYVVQQRVEQARTKYQFVVDLYSVRNEQLKAIEAYRRLADLSPDNMALRSKLANLMLQYGMKEDAAEVSLGIIQNYARGGQTERALEECRKLRTQAPQSGPIRLQYGELLNQLERYGEALPEFRRVLELEPSNLRVLCLVNITLFLHKEGEVKWTSFRTVVERGRESSEKLTQVQEEYRQAVFSHDYVGLHYAIGCLSLESKQTSVAIRSFELVVKKASEIANDPGLSDEYLLLGHWQLGQLYLAANRYDEAVAELGKSASLLDKADPVRFGASDDLYGGLPSQAQIYRKLAQAFTATGKIEYAAKALRTVKRLSPYDREVYFELADLNFQQGNLNEALVELGELATHYEQAGKSEDMVEVLKQMVRLAPNKIEVHDKLSQVYLQRGLIPAGLKELDELAELQRKNGRLKDAVRSLQKAAEINWMMGQQSKSYELYDRIVKISPGDVEARQQLVNLHIMAGRVKDAGNEQRTIAQICLQNNQTQEAIAALHQVIMLAPEDTRAYFQLASVLTTAGEFGQAYKLYNRVLRLEPANEKAQRLMAQVRQKGMGAGQIKPE